MNLTIKGKDLGTYNPDTKEYKPSKIVMTHMLLTDQNCNNPQLIGAIEVKSNFIDWPIYIQHYEKFVRVEYGLSYSYRKNDHYF